MTRPRSSPGSGRSFDVRAFAKVNLTLRVLGTRPDGYHELRTVFQSVALSDRLRFEVAAGPFRISSNEPGCPTDESNLVWQAAARMWRAAGRRGRPAGIRVHIHKRIPPRAGLGGGSSNAAAALRALAAVWCPRLEPARLVVMAAGLGADVPYFLTGGTALGVERGDRVFPLADHPRAWVVIVRPEVGVSTADAYRWLDDDRARRLRSRSKAVHTVPVLRAGAGPYREGGNDFQGVVERRHPVVKRLVAALRSGGAQWSAMSGSGSAVFGVFGQRQDAERVVERLGGQQGVTFLTRTVSAREYTGRSALRDLPGTEPIGYTHRLR